MALRYREVFFAANGFGPFTCVFCESAVEATEVSVHHVDHDRKNDSLENLVPAHQGCHSRAHNSGESPGMKRYWAQLAGREKEARHRELQLKSRLGTHRYWHEMMGKSCNCPEEV